jgi:hypothetical protein
MVSGQVGLTVTDAAPEPAAMDGRSFAGDDGRHLMIGYFVHEHGSFRAMVLHGMGVFRRSSSLSESATQGETPFV